MAQTPDALITSTNRQSFTLTRTYRNAEPAEKGDHPVTEYPAFIKDLLDAEEKRLGSLEARATTVITTSGVLVTLLLAPSALLTRTPSFVVPASAIWLAAVAAALFVIAAILAVWINSAWHTPGLDPAALHTELWARWGNAADDPTAKTTATRLAQWTAAQALVQQKAKLLFIATSLQAAALAVLAIATLVILHNA